LKDTAGHPEVMQRRGKKIVPLFSSKRGGNRRGGDRKSSLKVKKPLPSVKRERGTGGDHPRILPRDCNLDEAGVRAMAFYLTGGFSGTEGERGKSREQQKARQYLGLLSGGKNSSLQ